jgi:hypothetical protein
MLLRKKSRLGREFRKYENNMVDAERRERIFLNNYLAMISDGRYVLQESSELLPGALRVRRLAAILTISSFAFSLALLSLNINGLVISSGLTDKIANVFGGGLFIFGLIGSYCWIKSKR